MYNRHTLCTTAPLCVQQAHSVYNRPTLCSTSPLCVQQAHFVFNRPTITERNMSILILCGTSPVQVHFFTDRAHAMLTMCSTVHSPAQSHSMWKGPVPTMREQARLRPGLLFHQQIHSTLYSVDRVHCPGPICMERAHCRRLLVQSVDLCRTGPKPIF